MPEQRTGQLTRGVLWSAVERFSVQGMQFLITLAISYFVLPAEYGVVAIPLVFLAVAMVFVDSGFGSALVQKQNRTEIDFSTAFHFNMVVAVALYGILWAMAPLIAQFYEEELLTPILRWAGLVMPLNALSIVQQAKFTIAMDFRVSAKASLLATVAGGIVGIVMAWRGMGVWALVGQSLCSTLLKSLLLWYFVRWRVMWKFSWESFRGLFSFGSKLLVTALMHVIYKNMYTLVIGKRFSDVQVGLFNRANMFATFPSENLSSVFARASYPALCRIQDDDEALRRELIRHIRMAAFVIFPLMMALGVLAGPVVRVLMPESWWPVTPLLIILCAAHVLNPIRTLNWLMMSVKGRTDMVLRFDVLSKIVAVAILLASIPFGIRMMCWSLALSMITDIVIISVGTRRVIGMRLRREIVELLPVIGLTLLAGAAAWGASALAGAAWAKLLAGMAAGTAIYITGAWVVRLGELRFFIDLIRRR